MVTILRPLSISELLDRTFHLYRNSLLVFAGISALPQLCVLGLNLLIPVLLLKWRAMGLSPHTLIITLSYYYIVVTVVSLVCIQISHAATVVAVSKLHLGLHAHIGDAYREVKKSILRVIWIAFTVLLIVGCGTVLLVLPGIYWGIKYALAIPVTVLEKKGVSETLGRSAGLTDGRLGRIFCVYLLLVIFYWVLNTTFHFALGIGAPFTRAHAIVMAPAPRVALIAVSAFLSNTLAGPLLTIALTLIYYDERVRKEGFDLQLMMSNLEGNPQAAAAAPAS